MSGVPLEIELKLRVTPASMQRLGRDPLLKSAERPSTQKLKAVYYDTPELDLSRAGAALRVRRENGRWIQTLKWGGAVKSGLHERNEFEVELPGRQPDLSKVVHTGPDGVFHAPHVIDSLQPVFETHFTRSKRLLVFDGASTVEACLDRGEIRSGDRTESLSEVELELKRGAVPALFQLALKIAERAPVALEIRSKAERGYALFRETAAAPVKASAPVLAPEMSVNDAFVTLAWESLRQLHANETGVLEGNDPEYLHQMRVALRRLRSTFSAFSRAVPKDARSAVTRDLQWLGRILGPARDWDVIVTETLPAIRESAPEKLAFESLVAEAAARRVKAQRAVQRTLRSRKYQRVMLGIACWVASQPWREAADDEQRALLDSEVRGYAQAELERRYERVRKRGRKLEELDGAGRHALRIAIKKLRYPVEFFSSAFDAEAARQLRAHLTHLQDVLGTMNDAATLHRLLEDIFAGTTDIALAEARGVLFGWSAGHGEALGKELASAWRAFRRSETFW